MSFLRWALVPSSLRLVLLAALSLKVSAFQLQLPVPLGPNGSEEPASRFSFGIPFHVRWTIEKGESGLVTFIVEPWNGPNFDNITLASGVNMKDLFTTVRIDQRPDIDEWETYKLYAVNSSNLKQGLDSTSNFFIFDNGLKTATSTISSSSTTTASPNTTSSSAAPSVPTSTVPTSIVPTSPETPLGANSPSHINRGAISGGVIGGSVVILLIMLFVLHQRQKRRLAAAEDLKPVPFVYDNEQQSELQVPQDPRPPQSPWSPWFPQSSRSSEKAARQRNNEAPRPSPWRKSRGNSSTQNATNASHRSDGNLEANAQVLRQQAEMMSERIVRLESQVAHGVQRPPDYVDQRSNVHDPFR